MSFKAVGIWMGSPGGTSGEVPATLGWPHDYSHKGVSENIFEKRPFHHGISISIYIYMYIYYIHIYIYMYVYIYTYIM